MAGTQITSDNYHLFATQQQPTTVTMTTYVKGYDIRARAESVWDVFTAYKQWSDAIVAEQDRLCQVNAPMDALPYIRLVEMHAMDGTTIGEMEFTAHTNVDIAALRRTCLPGIDLHVIVETLQPADAYTGRRMPIMDDGNIMKDEDCV